MFKRAIAAILRLCLIATLCLGSLPRPGVAEQHSGFESAFSHLKEKFKDQRWRRLHWSMNEADVAALFSEKVKYFKPPLVYPQMVSSLAIPKTKIFGEDFVAYFYFSKDRAVLRQVMLRRDRLRITPKAFQHVSDQLSHMTGQEPEACRPEISATLSDETVHTWRYADGILSLRYQDFYHPGIKFQRDDVQVDKRALQRERRLISPRSLPRRITLRVTPDVTDPRRGCR